MFDFRVLAIVALANCVSGRQIKEIPYVGIMGGDPVDISIVPHMAQFYYKDVEFYCGGSIISDQHILTAAHCFYDYNPTVRDYKVILGTSFANGDGDVYKIGIVIVHPYFDEKEMLYDICLIKLNTPIKFGPKVAKIDLISADLKLKSGMMLEVTGWGKTYPFGATSDKLLQAMVPYVERRDCENELERPLTETEVCAGEKGKAPCTGDSGGPLTLNNTIVVGVTSYSVGFCGRKPQVYANVQYLLPWIRYSLNY